MVDVDTFLTTLYVMADDFCQFHPTNKKPDPEASLSASEVITLVIFVRWSRFASERDFYRYAEGHLLDAFPTLPDRSQFNRLALQRGSHRVPGPAPGGSSGHAKMPLRSPG